MVRCNVSSDTPHRRSAGKPVWQTLPRVSWEWGGGMPSQAGLNEKAASPGQRSLGGRSKPQNSLAERLLYLSCLAWPTAELGPFDEAWGRMREALGSVEQPQLFDAEIKRIAGSAWGATMQKSRRGYALPLTANSSRRAFTASGRAYRIPPP